MDGLLLFYYVRDQSHSGPRDPIYQDMASKFFEHVYNLQADATAWMGFFCSIMLEISLILANRDPTYQDMASKFFEHIFIL